MYFTSCVNPNYKLLVCLMSRDPFYKPMAFAKMQSQRNINFSITLQLRFQFIKKRPLSTIFEEVGNKISRHSGGFYVTDYTIQ